MPAGASPWVSANIPSSPEILRVLLNILIFPPVSVLMAFSRAVALIWAFSPMVTSGELISMFPAAPVLLVSVVILVPVSRLKLLVSILIAPAFPSPVVEAEMDMPSAIVRFWVSISIMPALPMLFVVTLISPSMMSVVSGLPVMFMVSGALINMLPPLPVELVEAEIKPWLLKLMSRFGLSL